MKADHVSQNDVLAFPASLSGPAGPNVEGPTRFARALKRARMARGWTQADLSAQLAIPKRSIVSWETGQRIPSVGMVLLLLDVFFPDEEPSLQEELIAAYLIDDLEHQAHRRGTQRKENDPLQERIQQVLAQVTQLSMSATPGQPARGHQQEENLTDARMEEQKPFRPQEKEQEPSGLEPLFALIAQLRHHPELISVTRDFLRELAPDE